MILRIQPSPPARLQVERRSTQRREEAGGDSQASAVELMLKIGTVLMLQNVATLAAIADPKWPWDSPEKIGMGSFSIILCA